MTPTSALRRLPAAIGLALGLTGCASAQPAQTATVETTTVQAATGAAQASAAAAATVVSATLTIGGSTYPVDWFLPTGDAVALVTVQHGFARQCSNVRETALRLAEAGLMGLCVNAGMAGGNPALAEALATTLLSGIEAPGHRPLPEKLIVGGHSAGSHFASRLGWQLAALAPDRLAGALLFDPVAANSSFTGNLLTLSASGQRPVLAITANGNGCNAQNNAYPALRQVQADARAAGRDGFVGLQLTDRSSHVDVEGRDSNLLGTLPCGLPRRANTETLRTLATQWGLDLASGSRTASAYPGGAYVDSLVSSGTAQVID